MNGLLNLVEIRVPRAAKYLVRNSIEIKMQCAD